MIEEWLRRPDTEREDGVMLVGEGRGGAVMREKRGNHDKASYDIG